MAFKPAMQSGNFAVEIDSTVVGFFKEISGIGIEMNIAADQLVSAQYKLFEPKMPAGQATKELTLKRGFTSDMVLYDWFDKILQGNRAGALKTISVMLCDHNFEVKAEFQIDNCWPSKLSQSDLNASGKEMLVEEMTIVYEHIVWQK